MHRKNPKSMNTLSVTVDIEDWYHIPSVTGSPFSVYKDVEEFFERWNEKYDYLSDPTGRVLDLLDEFDILLLVLEAVPQLLLAPKMFLLFGFRAPPVFLFWPILDCWTASLADKSIYMQEGYNKNGGR